MKQEKNFSSQQALSASSHTFQKGINDRLTTLTHPSSGNKMQPSSVHNYALTMTNPDEVKYKFYDAMDSVISATSRTDNLILLDDLNTRVGTG